MLLLLILVLTLSLAAATPIRLEVDAVLVSPINTTKIIDYVNSAREAIYMEVYVFTYKPLADALVAAARRGVDVYVVLSSRVFGGVPQQARDIAKYLEENGVKVVWNRDFPNVHTKLYVIDNRTVIIGNINPTRSGFLRNKGVMLVINNSTLARQLATVVLNDFHGRYPRYNFPGVLISPINSQAGLEWILSQPGTLYIAMEQIYVDSGLVPYILRYPEYYAVVARTNADIKTVFDDSLVAKIIVVGDYVYVGSINIGYYSIQRNREVGLLIHNPDLAHRMRTLILQWYREAGGEVGQVGVSTTDVSRMEVYDIQSLGVLTWIAIILAILLAVLRRVGGRR
jgi:phosphatidylserine/phosphatidylglycerophosphate/cardiolipin synthase-like enzyme